MHPIVFDGLTKDYGRGRGIFDLSLKIQPGRVHGFLGPNGAGKTTAIRMLMGYLNPDRGEAQVFGRPTSTHELGARNRIGYVPGDLALPEHLTARRYLADSARLHGGIDTKWRDELVALLGAEAELDVKMRTLSKGNKQKIALIDALQHRPVLLIMDEPTDGLDPLLRDRLRQVLRSHVQDGGTVFLSSHVVHEIETVCDDVSIIVGGRLRLEASIDELLNRQSVHVRARVSEPEALSTALTEAGATSVQVRGDEIRCYVKGDILPVMEVLSGAGAKETRVKPGDLEQLFLYLYEGATD